MAGPTADWILVNLARVAVWVVAFSIFFVATLFALYKREPITSYTTPKPESIATAVATPEVPGGIPPRLPNSDPPPSTDLKFEAPKEWTPTAGNGISLQAFEVVDGTERIDITLSRTGGGLLDNMNRWRGQVGLPPVKQDELAEALKPREVNGMTAMFIEMHSPDDAAKKESIFGVMVPEEGQTWFVKLRGSTKLAEQERERFEAFAKSLSW